MNCVLLWTECANIWGLLWVACAAYTAFLHLNPSDAYWPVSWWGDSDPGHWCEQDRGPQAFLREPVNAATDLAFLAVALAMLRCGLVDDEVVYGEPLRLSLRAAPELSWGAAIANVLHFVGTFSNHACRCHVGHVLDVFGMLNILSFFSIYMCCTLRALDNPVGVRPRTGGVEGANPELVIGLQIVVGAALWPASQLSYDHPWCEAAELGGFVCCLLPAAVAYALIRRRHASVRFDTRRMVRALVVLLVSVACQTLDQPRHGFPAWLCSPGSVLQLHGAWHLGTAYSLWTLFAVLRDVEEDVVPSPPRSAEEQAAYMKALKQRHAQELALMKQQVEAQQQQMEALQQRMMKVKFVGEHTKVGPNAARRQARRKAR